MLTERKVVKERKTADCRYWI